MSNPEDYLKKVIYYFMTLNKTPIIQTSVFKKYRHDELCARLRERIELILSYFERYRKISYTIHGIKEKGSDVVLRYYPENKSHFICFQIKSNGDLKDPNCLQKIKAQYADSENKFSFDDYYVVMGTDEKERRGKSDAIKADLSTFSKLTVIDPSQFLFLLGLNSAQVGAIVKSYANEGDLLIQSALNIVKGFLKPEYCLLFYMLDLSFRKGFASALDIDDIVTSKYLNDIYGTFPLEEGDEEDDPFVPNYYYTKDSRQMIEGDLNSENHFVIDAENKKIILDYAYLRPIICLILEAQIKYEFDTQETVEYLEQLIFGF